MTKYKKHQWDISNVYGYKRMVLVLKSEIEWPTVDRIMAQSQILTHVKDSNKRQVE